MSAQPKHNLEQYKKQAKDLIGAYRSADVGAVAHVRQHLPRLHENAPQSDIVLTEAQHVIACQHGFKRLELVARCFDSGFGTAYRDNTTRIEND